MAVQFLRQRSQRAVTRTSIVFDLWAVATHFVLLCIAVLVLPTIAAAQSSSFTFNVDSTKGWQTASILVQQGQKLTFSAEGAWTVDYRNFPPVGPDGYSPGVDGTIFQGCKLDPNLPYGTLLARIGDNPEFVVGNGGMGTASSNGALSFRIHDADACLGDNSGSVKVSVTSKQFAAAAQLPFFVCITGPGGGCQNVYNAPVAQANLPSPPEWLTSPLAVECLIPFTAQVLDKLMPGLGELANIVDVAGFYQTFYSLAEARKIPLTGTQLLDPLYWKTLVDALGQHVIVDSLTLQSCRVWTAALPN